MACGRARAEENVLGYDDISRAYFLSLARRTIVIKVQREDDERTSGYAVLDQAMDGMKDVAQCFDFASENAMTATGYDTGIFSLRLYHSSAVDMFVSRHGDDFVVSGTRTQQEECEERVSKHLDVKHLATQGPCTALANVIEVRILNRITHDALS